MKNVPSNLSNLKIKVDKLAPVPVDIKSEYNAKIKNIEDKIPDITSLATKTTFNAKTNEVKNEISSIINLAINASLNATINEVKNENSATTTALTAVENKVPNVNDLINKRDYDAEIKNIENKYFTTRDYNKFTNNKLDTKITAKQLVNESGLNEKIKTLTIKEEIKK